VIKPIRPEFSKANVPININIIKEKKMILTCGWQGQTGAYRTKMVKFHRIPPCRRTFFDTSVNRILRKGNVGNPLFLKIGGEIDASPRSIKRDQKGLTQWGNISLYRQTWLCLDRLVFVFVFSFKFFGF
jgi:hypothetical protein